MSSAVECLARWCCEYASEELTAAAVANGGVVGGLNGLLSSLSSMAMDGAGGGGGDNPTGGAVTEKPTTPTLCKAENQGECECKTGTGLATYVEGDVCVLCVYCVLYTVFVLCVIHTGNAPVYILHG